MDLETPGSPPFYQDPWLTIYEGNALDILKSMPSESVHMAVTSPPYWGLRDYGLPPVVWDGDPDCEHEWEPLGAIKRTGGTGAKSAIQAKQKGQAAIFEGSAGSYCVVCDAWLGQLGLEPSPDLYAQHLVAIFRELRRVLRHDGTFWLNIGDSYASYRDQKQVPQTLDGGKDRTLPTEAGQAVNRNPEVLRASGIKHKDLVGIPWTVAFAMRKDGWYLRSDVIWAKPNVMPESVTDRPTKSHEYFFLFSKSERYFYDSYAILEPLVTPADDYLRAGKSVRDNHAYGSVGGRPLGEKSFATVPTGRNKRTVWFVASQPYAGAHYAPFPPKLIEPTILAGTSERGVCEACGAPYRREVASTLVYDHTTTDPGKQPGGPYESQTTGGQEGHDVRHGVLVSRETTGWDRSCDHESPAEPAVVLDPFGGSGTTGMVAQKLSRRAILIDLNAEYLKQQLIRNANVPLGL